MAVTLADKKASRRHRWRVQERLLFFIAIMGGSPLMYITMLSVHHKTRHKRFMIGLPIMIVLQIAAIVALFYFGILSIPHPTGYTI
ncbi:MAG: DUF1294 domain-containing protein [Ruminococcaceae bacterium]|nr:DUF1294 domain-containing protein [Oscillospiraceae bacterium]